MEGNVEIHSVQRCRKLKLHTQLKVHGFLKHDFFEQNPEFSDRLNSPGKHRNKTMKGVGMKEGL